MFLFLWLGSRSDAAQHVEQARRDATDAAHDHERPEVGQAGDRNRQRDGRRVERDVAPDANRQLGDAQQRGSGLQNSVDGYKLCGADLGKFFQAAQADNEAQVTATLVIAKVDCDRIDPTIIPLTP